MDVEISRDDPYSLSIGGVLAVRFTTNVRDVVLIENYVPQADAYAEVNSTTGDLESNLIDATWGNNGVLGEEVQNVPISGPATANGVMTFLGTDVSYSLGDTAADIAATIAGDPTIITTWNAANPTQEIKAGGITAVDLDGDGTNDAIQITYEDTEGNVADIMGSTSNGITLSDSIEVTRGGSTSTKSEVQTLQLEGTTTDQAYFLGTTIIGSVSGESASATATRIADDETNGGSIISNWNNDPDNADKQIEKIEANATGELTITYKSHMGDVSIIEATSSRGITYNRSEETIKGAPEDSITYTLNNEYSLTVTNGETIADADGEAVDINGDGLVDNKDFPVTTDNAIQSLVYKINHDSNISDDVTAYNGKYELADDGTKILTNNPLHSDYDASDPYKERYLYVESNVDGEAGSFVGEVLVNDNNNVDATTGNYIGVHISTDDNTITQEALDDIHIEIFDEEIDIGSGSLKSMIDNIKTDSGNNHFNEYKEMLDNLAKTLSDYSSDYIETESGEYVYGLDAAQEDGSGVASIHLGLFTGADVKSLAFDANSINSLTQDNLDYLSSIQWKDDIDFKGTGIDTASFSEYYQELRVAIADTREGVIFAQESQAAVTESIQSSYDLLTKVDSDEEMIELIKYQAAYEANAKLITTVDEMLQTLLNM